MHFVLSLFHTMEEIAHQITLYFLNANSNHISIIAGYPVEVLARIIHKKGRISFNSLI